MVETVRPSSRKQSITSVMIVVLPAPERPMNPNSAGVA
jgi:hypothetical protein